MKKRGGSSQADPKDTGKCKAPFRAFARSTQLSVLHLARDDMRLLAPRRRSAKLRHSFALKMLAISTLCWHLPSHLAYFQSK